MMDEDDIGRSARFPAGWWVGFILLVTVGPGMLGAAVFAIGSL